MATLVAMHPALLAFDTSTEAMAVALQGPGGRRTWNGEGGAQASATLLPRIRDQLAELGLRLEDLDGIAFGQGPGAFTGLRTSCAVAQGLALGAGLTLWPIDSLLIVAEDARMQVADGADGADGPPVDVGVAMDARMGELYAGRYRWDGRTWAVLAAPALCDPADLARLWGGLPPLLAGSGVDMALAGCGVAPEAAGPRLLQATRDRAAALLRLAAHARARGPGIDAAEALPLYLRDKVAFTTLERAARRDPGVAAAGAGAAL